MDPNSSVPELAAAPKTKSRVRKANRSGTSLVATGHQTPISTEANVAELREVAIQHHLRAWQIGAAAAGHAVVAGRAFMEIKNCLPHGQFNRWVAQNVPDASKRTVERYMKMAKKWPELVRRLGLSKGTKATDLSQLDLLDRVNGLSQAEANRLIQKAPGQKSTSGQAPLLDEWLTPENVASRVMQFLGNVDLDPCAADGEQTVKADRRLMRNDDGLSEHQPWMGRVWLNPGHSQHIGSWIHRIAREHEAQSISEALVLVPVDLEASELAPLRQFPRVYLHSRLIVKPVGRSNAKERRLPFAAMIVLVSNDSRLSSFAESFSDLGDIYVRFSS